MFRAPIRRALRPAEHAVAALAERRLRWRLRSSPIRPLWHEEFERTARQHSYLRGRWHYMSVAAKCAGDLIARNRFSSALELGPSVQPLIVGADLMDRRAHRDFDPSVRMVVHDATKLPWPIADGRYDLFVALQVFEHLGEEQSGAFDEVRRVARNAIISLPIDWTVVDPDDLHYGISHERALKWFAPVEPTRVVLGNGGPRKRLVYIFEDLADGSPRSR